MEELCSGSHKSGIPTKHIAYFSFKLAFFKYHVVFQDYLDEDDIMDTSSL